MRRGRIQAFRRLICLTCSRLYRHVANTVSNFNVNSCVANRLEESAVAGEETGQVFVHLISVTGKSTVDIDCHQIHKGLTFDLYGKDTPG